MKKIKKTTTKKPAEITKATKSKIRMFNLQLYYKQGDDLNVYLETYKKEGVPTAVLTWLKHLEDDIAGLKFIMNQLAKDTYKKKIKCAADTNEIMFSSSNPSICALLDAHKLFMEDTITVELVYNAPGIDSKLEAKLHSLAQNNNGTMIDAGYFFTGREFGQRDMTFEFETQEAADAFEKAANKLIPKKMRVSI
jgi:hypothetical protein